MTMHFWRHYREQSAHVNKALHFFSFFFVFWFTILVLFLSDNLHQNSYDISISLKQLKNVPGKNRDNFCENCHGKKRKKIRQVTTFGHCVTGYELHAWVHVKKKFYGKFVS